MRCPACDHRNLPGADACAACSTPLAHLDGPAAQDRVETSLMTDPVTVLEPRPPVTVPLTATMGHALHAMIGQGVGAVLVIGDHERVVGILTERDFLTKAAGEPNLATRPVTEFHTPHPETVSPTDTLAFALGKMDAGGYRHLPVVLNGTAVGVISVRDILRHVTDLCHEG